MTAFNWALLTAFIWGVVPLLEKMGLAKVTPVVGLFYRCLGVVIGILLLSIFIVKPQEIKSVDFRTIVLLTLAGFLASFLGQICFYHGLKMGEISRVVPIAGTFPLIAFILGVIFLGEAINPVKIGGILLITAGIWALKIG